MSIDVRAELLTTCAVAADGAHVRLNFKSEHGRPTSLTLPTDLLQQLIMTLPQLLSNALKAQFSNDYLRAVFPLGSWRIEQAAGVVRQFILTLRTPDGFEVAFSLSVPDIAQLVSALQPLGAAYEKERERLDS